MTRGSAPDGAATLTRYEQFRGARRFDALQQLRTLSVVLVVTFHMQDPLWARVHGMVGVTIFFVISGFLITTLLLREEDREGRVSLKGFYIRRAFRILPMYLAALAAFAVLILGLGIGGRVDKFRVNLPFYLTYQNEFAPEGPFGHTWSLAVEEKFYLLWPVLLLLIPALRRRRSAVVVVLLAVAVGAELADLYHLSTYAPILLGCLLALTMHSARGFRVVDRLTHPLVTAAFVVAAVVAAYFDTAPSASGHLFFAFAVALALPGLLVGRSWIGPASSLRPLVRLGEYTYTVYLIHPLTKGVVDKVFPEGQHAAPVEVLRFLLVTGLSFVTAAVIYRLFEGPVIRFGRRLAGKPARGPSVLSDPDLAVPPRG